MAKNKANKKEMEQENTSSDLDFDSLFEGEEAEDGSPTEDKVTDEGKDRNHKKAKAKSVRKKVFGSGSKRKFLALAASAVFAVCAGGIGYLYTTGSLPFVIKQAQTLDFLLTVDAPLQPSVVPAVVPAVAVANTEDNAEAFEDEGQQIKTVKVLDLPQFNLDPPMDMVFENNQMSREVIAILPDDTFPQVDGTFEITQTKDPSEIVADEKSKANIRALGDRQDAVESQISEILALLKDTKTQLAEVTQQTQVEPIAQTAVKLAKVEEINIENADLKERLFALQEQLALIGAEKESYESKLAAKAAEIKRQAKLIAQREAELKKAIAALSTQDGEITSLKLTVAKMESELREHRSRPLLPGWKVSAISGSRVIFREEEDTNRMVAIRAGHSWNGLMIKDIDVKNGVITTNWGDIHFESKVRS